MDGPAGPGCRAGPWLGREPRPALLVAPGAGSRTPDPRREVASEARRFDSRHSSAFLESLLRLARVLSWFMSGPGEMFRELASGAMKTHAKRRRATAENR